MLKYGEIEPQLVEHLPEIGPAAECYWHAEGTPGNDCGPYTFFEDMFARYVEVLLRLRPSERRNELLQRALSFVERMLGCNDTDVRNLAYIGMWEGRPDWMLARAAGFLGPHAVEIVDRERSGWRDSAAEPTGDDVHDGFGIRELTARELRPEGVTLDDIPGRTYQRGRSP